MTHERSLLEELRHEIAHPDTSGAPYVNDEVLLARCLAEIERLRAALTMLIREAQNVADDHHRPRYARLDEALESAREALGDADEPEKPG